MQVIFATQLDRVALNLNFEVGSPINGGSAEQTLCGCNDCLLSFAQIYRNDVIKFANNGDNFKHSLFYSVSPLCLNGISFIFASHVAAPASERMAIYFGGNLLAAV